MVNKTALFFQKTQVSMLLFFPPMCTHRPQSNYNLLGWNYSKKWPHLLAPHREYGLGEIWGKLLLAKNIIIYIHACVFLFDKWLKFLHRNAVGDGQIWISALKEDQVLPVHKPFHVSDFQPHGKWESKGHHNLTVGNELVGHKSICNIISCLYWLNSQSKQRYPTERAMAH